MIFAILDFIMAAYGFLYLTGLICWCIYGVYKGVTERTGDAIPALVIGFAVATMIYESVKLHFCEKKKVEVACCVDGDYDRGGYHCTEMDYCEKEVCVD